MGTGSTAAQYQAARIVLASFSVLKRAEPPGVTSCAQVLKLIDRPAFPSCCLGHKPGTQEYYTDASDPPSSRRRQPTSCAVSFPLRCAPSSASANSESRCAPRISLSQAVIVARVEASSVNGLERLTQDVVHELAQCGLTAP
jgi:hypothetical protein